MPRSSTVSAAVVAGLIALAVPVGAAVGAPQSCPATMTFVVGGVGDPAARFVPTDRGAKTRIHYPASLAPVGTVFGDWSVRAGERALDTTARAFARRCPDSTIHVRGHSMGALVAGNVRDRWQRDRRMREHARFTLIADPRSPNGAMSRLPSFIPGFTHTGPRPSSTIPTSTVCRTVSDIICSTGDVLADPLHAANALIGYFTGEHNYRLSEVSDAPGVHTVPGRVWFRPPSLDAAFAAIVDAGHDMLRVLAPAVVPMAQFSVTAYVPTALKQYVPPFLAPLVPAPLGEIVPPPIVPPPAVQSPTIPPTPPSASIEP